MQVLGQQHSILNIINPGNWRRGVVKNRTILEDRQNVLEQNIIEGSHRIIVNVTSWPLLFGARCVASQYFAPSSVATQNGPSRTRASSLKAWRCGVSVVVVILSSGQWWSTKIKLSKEVFMVNSLTYKKKLYLGDYTSTHHPPS
jgi:hypothetical protein